MNTKIVQITLSILIVLLLIAGTFFLFWLGQKEEHTAQKTRALLPSATAIVINEVVGEAETSAPPTPTAIAGRETIHEASPEVMEEIGTPESPLPTSTPPIVSTPIVTTEQDIVISTQIPPTLPTLPPPPTSTPIPSSTIAPLPGEPIGGYVFGSPELLLTHNYIEFVGWLPDSNEELITRNFEDDKFLIELLNIKTGQRRRVVETSRYIVGKPVWLPATQQMAYLAQDETGATNLYLGGIGAQNVSAAAVSDVSPPLVPDETGVGVLVFDAQMQQLFSTNKDAGAIQGMSVGELLPAVEGGPFPHYQATWSDQTDWVAYYHPAKFLLVNSKTGETQEVDLGKAPGDWGQWGAIYATWSPDGQRLAVIVTPADYAIFDPAPFTKLAIYIPDTKEIRLIEDDFTFVTNAVWSPDGSKVLISAVIGQLDGYDVEALFLVDITTNQINPVPVMPDNALGLSFFSSLAWSPDGKQIIVGYAEQPGKVGWYRVTVKKP